MRDAWRSIALFCLVLLVPVIPFALLGQRFEEQILQWVRIDLPASAMAAVTIGTLAIDIFLPVPSSAVCTLAGDRLGVMLGALTCWIGLTGGGMAGYGLSYWLGEKAVGRWIRPQQAQRARHLYDKMGPILVVVSRPVPILAEATLLWLGLERVNWRSVFPALALANLVVALGYTALGQIAGQRDWLVPALVLATALPIGLWLVALRYFRSLEQRVVEHESE